MTVDKHMVTELSDILDQDIETIVSLRMNAERKVSRHQRIMEKVTSVVGRPQSVYIVSLLIVVWMVVNMFHNYLALPAMDTPPFPVMQDIASIIALLMTMIVLTSQTRQGKLMEQRRHLDLQINLLTERKVSKLIELIEDLRKDMPSVRNRVDQEAEVMKEPVDPHTALTALNKTLQEATKEYELEFE